MDRIEDLLRRIHDPRECVELLLAAPRADAGNVARQLAAVLSSLPAVHRELAGAHGGLAVEELVRRVGGLELLLLNVAGRKFRAGGFSGAARSLVSYARRRLVAG